jgi:hypothetical protein
MSRHDGIFLITPVIFDVVNVRVTDATEQNIDFNIFRKEVPAFEVKRHKIRIGAVGSVALDGGRHF